MVLNAHMLDIWGNRYSMVAAGTLVCKRPRGLRGARFTGQPARTAPPCRCLWLVVSHHRPPTSAHRGIGLGGENVSDADNRQGSLEDNLLNSTRVRIVGHTGSARIGRLLENRSASCCQLRKTPPSWKCRS